MHIVQTLPDKIDNIYSINIFCRFITFGTQAGADRAVSEFNHKEMKKGHISQRLFVMYSLNYEGRYSS